jgi:hypothetical protein
MVDLRPWRLAVAVVLLAALTLRLLATVLSVAAAGRAGMAAALAEVGTAAGDVVLIVALAAVGWWCAADRVRGASVIAIVGVVLVLGQVVVFAAAAVAEFLLSSGPLGSQTAVLLIQLAWLVVPLLAAAVLLWAARASRAGAGQPEAAGADPAHQGSPRSPEAPEPAESPVLPESTEAGRPGAGWASDDTAGAVWTSAGEAARGGAAARWTQDSGTGWDPSEWRSDPTRGHGVAPDEPIDPSAAPRPEPRPHPPE